MGSSEQNQEGDTVRRTGKIASSNVGEGNGGPCGKYPG